MLESKQRLFDAAAAWMDGACIGMLAAPMFAAMPFHPWPTRLFPPFIEQLLAFAPLVLFWEFRSIEAGWGKARPTGGDIAFVHPRLIDAIQQLSLPALAWAGVAAALDLAGTDTIKITILGLGMASAWQAYGASRLRRFLFRFLKRRGCLERVIVIGANSAVLEDMTAIIAAVSPAMAQIVARIPPEKWLAEFARISPHSTAGMAGLAKFLPIRYAADAVILDGTEKAGKIIAEHCRTLGIECIAVRRQKNAGNSQNGIPFPEPRDFSWRVLAPPPPPETANGRLARNIGETLLAGMLFLLALPLAVLIALAVRATSPGPILFRQKRMGYHGRVFEMLKFRSMRIDPPLNQDSSHAPGASDIEPEDILFKPSQDPRTTPLGRWLRRSSMDELPQLWNVVRGEMSLVGPRPMPLYEIERFHRLEYFRRHAMKPGITGLWQVSGRSAIRTLSERIRLDLEFIDHWTFWNDLRLLVRTIPAVLCARGAQ